MEKQHSNLCYRLNKKTNDKFINDKIGYCIYINSLDKKTVLIKMKKKLVNLNWNTLVMFK